MKLNGVEGFNILHPLSLKFSVLMTDSTIEDIIFNPTYIYMYIEIIIIVYNV